MKKDLSEEIKRVILHHLFKEDIELISDKITVQYLTSSLFPLYILESTVSLNIKNHSFTKIAIKLIENKDMAYTEFEGLQLLYNFKARTPFPITVIDNKTYALLLLEFVEQSTINKENKNDLILSLKNLYQHRGLTFGHDNDNYIGTLIQKNAEYKKFLDFWWESRIEPMMDLAIKKEHFKVSHKNSLYKIIKQLIKVWNFDKDSPRPIHGDLWSGNIIFSKQYAYLIDPSFGYSHPVQDFAMLELFGSPLTFSDYQEIARYCNFIMIPEMIEFFQIYPLLVHVNIFGASYKAGILNFINKYK
ncbi:MAG: fructosamine-3-kinase [Leptospiraceae bacterium]|nr:MAG: fructosamine-3-kinase [Leptospiraceae bacterium]